MNQILELESVVSSAEEVLRGESIIPACPHADAPFDIRDENPTDYC